MNPAEAMMNTVEWKPVEPDAAMLVDAAIPYATHEGVLTIMGFAFQCYQLSDGKRVIAEESIVAFFDSFDD